MGVALDTILGNTAVVGALSTVTAVAPDTFTVRNFDPPAYARLEQVIKQSAAADHTVRVKSPMMHDDVNGLTFLSAETPTVHLLPREVGEPLISGNSLTVQADLAAAGNTTVVLGVYYSDLPGAAQKLYGWGDIRGIIKHIKAHQVNSGATAAGAWTDTVITTTENLLHDGSYYAVLGYLTDAAVAAVGVKGQFTSNLRVCGPGQTPSFDTSEFFVAMSEQQQTPHIPVFNARDRGAIFLSAAANAAVSPKVSLILAELTQPLA